MHTHIEQIHREMTEQANFPHLAAMLWAMDQMVCARPVVYAQALLPGSADPTHRNPEAIVVTDKTWIRGTWYSNEPARGGSTNRPWELEVYPFGSTRIEWDPLRPELGYNLFVHGVPDGKGNTTILVLNGQGQSEDGTTSFVSGEILEVVKRLIDRW